MTDDKADLAVRLIEALPVPVAYLDPELVVKTCSESAALASGVSVSRLIGQRVPEVLGAENDITRMLNEVVRSQSQRSVLTTYGPPGQPERDWEVVGVPDFVGGDLVGLIVVGFDVSDLVDIQRQLTESEQLYRSIGELLPFGTWTADADGGLTYLSQSFVEMTGRRREDLLGWGWLDLMPDEQCRNEARAEWHRMSSERRLRDTKHIIKAKDGTYRHILCRGVRLSGEPGAGRAWAGIHVDVTESERQLGFRQALSSVKDLLVTTLDTERLLAEVGAAILEPSGADFTAIVAPDGACWRIRYVAGEFEGLDTGTTHPRSEMPLNALAFDSGEIQIAVEAASDPRVNTERARADGVRSIAILPVKRFGGVFCLLFLAYRNAHIVDDAPLMTFFKDLLGSLDLALQAASVHEHQRHIAERLQESLLEVPDHLPNVELAHLYQAAAEEERVGGDFYDAFKIRDRVAFLVGDIAGSGLEAAALTALARNTIRAHLIDGQSPGTALSKANIVMHAFTEAHEFATVFVGVLSPKSGRLHYSCAGHPPPIAVGPSGSRPIEGGGTLLGAFEDACFENFTTHLDRDETIVLYTDGITEARRGSELYGQERLSEFLESIDEAEICALPRMVLRDAERFADDGLADDVALLALRSAVHSRREEDAPRLPFE